MPEKKDEDKAQLKLPANIDDLGFCGISPYPGKRDFLFKLYPEKSTELIIKEEYTERWREYHLLKKQKAFEEYKKAEPRKIIKDTRAIIKEVIELSEGISQSLLACEGYPPLEALIDSYEKFMDRFSQHYVMDYVLTESKGPISELENALDISIDKDVKHQFPKFRERAEIKSNVIYPHLDGKKKLPDNMELSAKTYELAEQLSEIKKLEEESRKASMKYGLTF